MDGQVKVSTKNQIALPAAARRQLGIKPGDRLFWVVRDGVLTLVPIPDDPIEALRGLGAEIWEGIDAQEYVNQLRDEW